MIQIDMQMPKNCLDCPACNEYLMCGVPCNGRGWGENDVSDYFTNGRPEWCPLKEQKWTSVKERYPDKEGFYLVSADHGNYLPWIAEMKTLCGVKGFCNGATMPCVGAWMPLPKPYNRTD